MNSHTEYVNDEVKFFKLDMKNRDETRRKIEVVYEILQNITKKRRK